MENTLEVILTIIAMSFWFLFPIGMFISVNHVDKNTDQIIRLDKLRHNPIERDVSEEGREDEEEESLYRPHYDWHHPVTSFKEWIQHDY